MINRKVFFDLVKKDFYPKGFTQKQVEGLDAVLDEWQKRKLTDNRWLAYILATVYHETAHTFQPVKEGLNASDAWRKKNLRYYPWYGRGWVQLTWKYNYEKQSKKLGYDLIANPDLLLTLPVSAAVCFGGMIDGDFTGKKLADYFTPLKEDWVNARRIINGTDRAAIIATYGKKFNTILKQAANVPVSVPDVTGVPVSKGGDPKSPATPKGQKESIWLSIWKGLINVLKALTGK